MGPLFGAKLRTLRQLHGLSQDDLVSHLSAQDGSYTITQSTISNVERGHDVPSLDLALRIARLFGVPLSYFLREGVLTPSHQPSFLPQQLGAKLQSLRKARRLTQGAVAQALEESRTYLSNLENGSRHPSLALLVRIAAFYQVSIDLLVDDTLPIPSALPTNLPDQQI